MKKTLYILAVAALAASFTSCEKEDLNSSKDTTPARRTLGANGTGGSMAQFTVVDNFLYTVDYKSLKVFDVSISNSPVFLQSVDLGVGIETVYPQDNYLFIGTSNGIRIVDISEPSHPTITAEFDHLTSCDPIVARENVAAATLRGGTACGGNLNSLDILDLSDINNPNLRASLELVNPYGLGFADNTTDLVYVCDGYNGFKAFNISSVDNPVEVMHMNGIEALDVISQEDHLIVLTRSSVIQYDATNPTNLVEKSIISIQ